jgi:hypothetical protein
MFTAVRRALSVICSAQKSGNAGRILNLTAALICGIIRNKDCHLSHAADEIPDNALPASNEKRLYRLMKNEKFDLETYFLPFAQALLSCLSRETLVLAIDGSTVGRGCMALVVSVVYKQRALPIAWLVVKGLLLCLSSWNSAWYRAWRTKYTSNFLKNSAADNE